jgi:hypothetical protein
LDDGDKFMFVKRMLPDVTFEGSTADAPAATMTLSPMENSGSGYNNPLSEGGNSSATVTRSATVPIEQFTGQVFVRVRGRQMAFKIESTELGVAWKLGIPRSGYAARRQERLVAERLVQKFQTPALPIPRGPLKHYLDDLNNILRLFFNLLANAVNNVFGELGGRFIDVPNALYFSTVDQPIAVVDTAQGVTFNQTYLESGFSINGGSNSQITATYGGVYNFQFIGQISSGSASN